MTIDIILTNAKAYVNEDIIECSIAIEAGKIFKIGNETNMPNFDQKIDLHGKLVLPGLIDPHVHLRDEEKAYKETFATGTAAAVVGGVTTVLDMPNNTPVTMNTASLQNRMQKAKKRIYANVGFYSEFPTEMNEVKKIVDAGAVGFKLFLGEKVGGLNIDDDQTLEEAFKIIAELDLPVAVHGEDHQMLKKNIEKLKLTKREDINAFLKAHDEFVESVAINRMLKINSQIEKMRLHFCHLSTELGLNAIVEAKKAGKNVTCEVTPHNLFFTKDNYQHLGMRAITMPPLRTKENVDKLWVGIQDGFIDCIGSDHAPHSAEEKESHNIWEIKAGIPGLETTLPLMLTSIHRNQLTLKKVIQLLSEKPAEIFSLTDRGKLEQGKNADITVVDFNVKFKIDSTKFQSKAKYSPFNGLEVQGKPIMTFVNGQLAMEEGIVAEKSGNIIVARGEQK